MNEVFLNSPRRYAITMDGITLHMASCKVTGVCSVTEQAASNGLCAVAEICPKGTRLELCGVLPPETDTDSVIAVLAAWLQAGTLQNLTLGTLVCAQARLCGYTVSDAEAAPEIVLKYYVPGAPVKAGDGA